MKKLTPFVLGILVMALAGCTTTTTAPSASTTTTTRKTNASMDPTLANSRTTQMTNRGPR